MTMINGSVATHTTLEGAAKAATHLVKIGFDEEDVSIGPRGFRSTPPHPLRRELAHDVYVCALTGGVLALAVAGAIGLGLAALAWSVVVAVCGLVIGAFLGMIVAPIRVRRRTSRTFGEPVGELRPSSFEVLVRRGPEDAGHRPEMSTDVSAATVPKQARQAASGSGSQGSVM